MWRTQNQVYAGAIKNIKKGEKKGCSKWNILFYYLWFVGALKIRSYAEADATTGKFIHGRKCRVNGVSTGFFISDVNAF